MEIFSNFRDNQANLNLNMALNLTKENNQYLNSQFEDMLAEMRPLVSKLSDNKSSELN